jgi:hypothetical protein
VDNQPPSGEPFDFGDDAPDDAANDDQADADLLDDDQPDDQ